MYVCMYHLAVGALVVAIGAFQGNATVGTGVYTTVYIVCI